MTKAKNPAARPSTSQPSPQPSPQPYHHGSLRAGLIDAADAVLAERGLQGLTLREVARMAGVSHAAPYHHFAGIDGLLAAVAERGFIELGDEMQRCSAVADTRERMLRVSHAYVASARATPARFRLMFGPLMTAREEHPALRAAAERAFGFVLAAAKAHDPKHGGELALAGWSMAHGLANLLIDGAFEGMPTMRGQDPDKLARRLAARLLRG